MISAADEFIKTHHNAIMRALTIAMRAAPEVSCDTDDKRYWAHEMQALRICLEAMGDMK